MIYLETERLSLRNLELSDAESISGYRNDEACRRYQRWEAFTLPDVEAYIEKFQSDVFLSDRQEQHFGIAQRNSLELVGELAYFISRGTVSRWVSPLPLLSRETDMPAKCCGK